MHEISRSVQDQLKRVYLIKNIEVVRICRKFQLSKLTEVSAKSLSVGPLVRALGIPGVNGEIMRALGKIFREVYCPRRIGEM